MNDGEPTGDRPGADGAHSKMEGRRSVMGCANVAAIAALIIWLSLFIGAADHYRQLPSYGYSGEWDFWVYFPLGATLVLILSLAIFNFVIRSGAALIALALTALLAALPYLVMTGGGV